MTQQFRSGPWKPVSVDRPAGVVVVKIADGGCLEFVRVDVEETPAQVVLTSVLRDVTEPGIVYNADLRTGDVRVPLDAPLGDRRSVHAPVEVMNGELR
ncbi:MAG: hypothetical protein J7518_10970 [Nocardioidaceae bacterium]|nr:hypothetical protein [Nocardioidaceae bacterium]